MRRAHHPLRGYPVLAAIAGVVWGGMAVWALNRPETARRVRIRTAAFVVMAGAGMLAAPARRENSRKERERW